MKMSNFILFSLMLYSSRMKISPEKNLKKLTFRSWQKDHCCYSSPMSTLKKNKKKLPVVKPLQVVKPTAKKPQQAATKSVKKGLPSKKLKAISSKSLAPKSGKQGSKTSLKKKVVAKKNAPPLAQDKLAKESLKLVDKAASLIRKGIKKGSKATHEVRSALHQEAHLLLGTASSNLDHILKSSASFLHSAIDKV